MMIMLIPIWAAFYPNIAENKKVQKVGMISSVFVEDRIEMVSSDKIFYLASTHGIDTFLLY